MFNLFKFNKPFEPLDQEKRSYFENNLLWLEQEFPELSIEERKIYVPTDKDFPISWSGTEENAHELINIISERMNIDPNEVELHFFRNGINEINMGSESLFPKYEEDEENIAMGMYHEKNEEGKYLISLDVNLLTNQLAVIATLAHELSHVKLLGQKELEFNDEYLTDLACAFFGFGIFNANQAFQFHQQNDRWSHQKSGYLEQEEWAYALALMAYIRAEENLDWSHYLTREVKKYFDKCLKYIQEHEEVIFGSESK